MGAGDYRAVMFWQGGAGQGFAYNVLHLKGDPGIANQANADQNAGLFDSALTTFSGEQVFSSAVVCQHLTLQELTSPPSAEFIGLIAHPGTATGQLLPPQLSLVTSLHTAQPGKTGRGRIYGWGYTEVANGVDGKTDGVFNVLQNDTWDGWGAALALAGDFRLAVYSRLNDESYEVTSCTTNQVWDTQRRRIR